MNLSPKKWSGLLFGSETRWSSWSGGKSRSDKAVCKSALVAPMKLKQAATVILWIKL